jgi:hypothetical protein
MKFDLLISNSDLILNKFDLWTSTAFYAYVKKTLID